MHGMNTNAHTDEKPGNFAIEAVRLFCLWYFANLGCLTVLTHVAQIVSMKFQAYAVACLFVFACLSTAFLLAGRKIFRRGGPIDPYSLLFIMILGLMGTLFSVSFHRLGRSSPDEYYYAANPVYYQQHPHESLGFETRTLYSHDPLASVAFFTAGAFEYIQGAVAFLANIEFAKVYYLLFAGLNGFVIVWAIFLALVRFSDSTAGALVGTFFTISFIQMLGETSWAPGAFSFVRSFEGKSVLIFGGIPLFFHFSLKHFEEASLLSWLRLAILLAAFVGLSTTAFMIFPIFGLILFASYWLVRRPGPGSIRSVLRGAFSYFSSSSYLVLYGLFVSAKERYAGASVSGNLAYPTTLSGYLSGFYNPAMPLTPLLVVVFSLIALSTVRNDLRRFLAVWIMLVLLTVFNPWVASGLLYYFRAIYYRLFYVFPFPLVIGVAFSSLFGMTAGLRPSWKSLLWICTGAGVWALLFWLPSSIFRGSAYASGPTYRDEEMTMAREALNVLPKDVMLAPYPLSGAINMLDSRSAQLLTRGDILEFYLNPRGQEFDARLRMDANEFLTGDPGEDEAFMQMIDRYPEIRSVVFYRKFIQRREYSSVMETVGQFLRRAGFGHSRHTADLLMFWK